MRAAWNRRGYLIKGLAVLCTPICHASLGLCVSCLLTIAGSARAADQQILDQAVLIVAADEPSFVKYGVEELRDYLQQATGNDITVTNAPTASQKVRIVIGAKAAKDFTGIRPTDEQLGTEGYLLRSTNSDGIYALAVAGQLLVAQSPASRH